MNSVCYFCSVCSARPIATASIMATQTHVASVRDVSRCTGCALVFAASSQIATHLIPRKERCSDCYLVVLDR